MNSSADPSYQLDKQRVENAIKSDDPELLRKILETSPYTKQLLQCKNSKSKFLDEATSMGNGKTVRVLLESGVELSSHHYPSVFWQDNLEIIKLFIEFQFDVFAEMNHQSITNIICNDSFDECVFRAIKMTDPNDLCKFVNEGSSYIVLASCCYYDSIDIFNKFFTECAFDHKYHILFWSTLSVRHGATSKILTYALEKCQCDEHMVREALNLVLKCKSYSSNIGILLEYLHGIDPDASLIETFVSCMVVPYVKICLEHNHYDSMVQSKILQLFVNINCPSEGDCCEDEETISGMIKLFIEHNFDLSEIFDELLIIAYVCNYKDILKILKEFSVDKSLVLERIMHKFQKILS